MSWRRHSPATGSPSPPTERGFNTGKVATLWVELMAALGYDRFGSHGGDWGSAVTTGLGARHPEHMIGIHLSMLAPPIDEATLTPEQREWWEALKVYRDQEWGYVHLQRTKPQTPSFALTDSPVGLAAWILEKWWRWSDIADEHGVRDPYRRYTRDELLTTVMIYWVTRSIGPSLRLYAETFGAGSVIRQPSKIEVPTGVALFNEINRPPRELAEPYYNIQRWVDIDDGGHFPAMENPDALGARAPRVLPPVALTCWAASFCDEPHKVAAHYAKVELEVQLGVAAHEHGGLPHRRRVGVEPERRRTREQRLDRAARFEPGERRAEAEVQPAPEREVDDAYLRSRRSSSASSCSSGSRFADDHSRNRWSPPASGTPPSSVSWRTCR